MIRKVDNLVSITLAVVLHVVLFGSLIVVLDFGRDQDIQIPLTINATLITENAVVIPPPVQAPPKEEVAPKVEPPPPQPDTQEQERIAAERRKLEEDTRVEKARLQKIEDDKAEAERKRLADAEKQRKAAEAKAAEAEEERRRVEAEDKRKADIERQRAENERVRKETEDAARQAELDKESARVEQITATAKQAYIFAIQQDITRNWVQPANAQVGLECTIKVQQMPGGEVVSVSFGACNGDATIRRSIEAAVFKASPLPAPRDPSVFDRNLTLIFKPEV